MPLQELIAFTDRPPAAGPRVLFRRYTKCGPEAWRFARIPPIEREGRTVLFRAFELFNEPPKRLPEVGIVADYVDKMDAEIFRADKAAGVPLWKWTPAPSSPTSPLDRPPPMRAEPVPPAPGRPTRSSRGRSSAAPAATTTGGQLKLDL